MGTITIDVAGIECSRPEGMSSELFISAWAETTPTVNHDFSESSAGEACDELADYRTYRNADEGNIAGLSYFEGEFESLFGLAIGDVIYRSGFLDCTKIPDGFYWYKAGVTTGSTLVAYLTDSVYIVTIVDGIVTDMTLCNAEPAVITVIAHGPEGGQTGGTNRFGFTIQSTRRLTSDVIVEFDATYDANPSGVGTYSGTITLPSGNLEYIDTALVITDASPAGTVLSLVTTDRIPTEGSMVTDSDTSEVIPINYSN